MSDPSGRRAARCTVDDAAAAERGAARARCLERMGVTLLAGIDRIGLHAFGGAVGEVAAIIDRTPLRSDATGQQIEALWRRAVGESEGVKAAGGVKDLDDVRTTVGAGASRIGTSAGVRIVQESNGSPKAAGGILGQTLYEEKSVANLNREQLRRLARLGAIARLAQLREEEAAIRAEFPELFGRAGRAGGTPPPASATKPRRRQRPSMSAAARKAVSERMRKYWAERRRTKTGKAAK